MGNQTDNREMKELRAGIAEQKERQEQIKDLGRLSSRKSTISLFSPQNRVISGRFAELLGEGPYFNT